MELIDLSTLTVLISIITLIVQLIKDYIPKRVPTQIVTLFCSLIVVASFGFHQLSLEGLNLLYFTMTNGLFCSFSSMIGFDNTSALVKKIKEVGKND